MFFGQMLTEIIKTFYQRRGVGKEIISFLKDLKTSYLPMHLSQFRKFLQKLTFFEGGGLKQGQTVTLEGPYTVEPLPIITWQRDSTVY